MRAPRPTAAPPAPVSALHSLSRLELGSARRLTRDCNCGLYVEMLVIQSREPIG